MKRLTLAVLAVCLSAAALIMPARAAEMRGLWVDAYHPGLKNPAEVTALVAKAKECNFNALFVQVRKRGDVLYSSKIEPMASDVMAGYDPLADVISKAHAAGIEVHAWMTMYEVYHQVKWQKANPKLVHVLHPGWLTRDTHKRVLLSGARIFLDPGRQEVRDYLLGLVKEVATNYNVDGIQLDSVKYPMLESGYNKGALEAYVKETGGNKWPDPRDKGWCEWRQKQVTGFISQAYAAVTQIKPDVKVSTIVFPGTDTAKEAALQDWVGWIEQGIVDFAVPMVFAEDNRVFSQTVAECLSAAQGKRHVYIGHAGWNRGPEQSVERIGMVREAGAPGTVVFSYWWCTNQPDSPARGALNALKQGPYARSDTTPGMSWKRKQ